MTAYNDYGESLESEIGGGALVETVPSVPTSLENVPSITLDDRIGLIWIDGVSNGGTQVIDYQVWHDQGTGSAYVLLGSSLTERSFTSTSLFSATTYSFKVKARNAVGYSDFSLPVSILAAQIPD